MVKTLVLDAGALLRCGPRLLEGHERFVTTEAALKEVRDADSKARLEAMPWALEVRTVSKKYVKLVSDFARVTGEYAQLSTTDLGILALAAEVEAEAYGSMPAGIEEVLGAGNARVSVVEPKPRPNLPPGTEVTPAFSYAAALSSRKVVPVEVTRTTIPTPAPAPPPAPPAPVAHAAADCEGWSSPSNPFAASFGGMEPTTTTITNTSTGCATTDFAMQNVLLKLKLTCVGVDNMVVKQVRHYALYCYSCFQIEFDTSKLFCGDCGADTLNRVSYETRTDGTVKYFTKSGFVQSTRGSRYAIGKQENLLLREDQLLQRGKFAELKRKNDAKKRRGEEVNETLKVGKGRRNPNANRRRPTAK